MFREGFRTLIRRPISKNIPALLPKLTDHYQWFEQGWGDRYNKKRDIKKWHTIAQSVLQYIDQGDESRKNFTRWFVEQNSKVQYQTLELLACFTNGHRQDNNSKRQHDPFTIELVSDLYSSLLKSYFLVDRENPHLIEEKRRELFADNIRYLEISPLSIQKAWNKFLGSLESSEQLAESILKFEIYSKKHFSLLLASLGLDERREFVLKHKFILIKLRAIDESDNRFL